MRSQFRHRRIAPRAMGAGVLLAVSIGLSGCHWWADLEPGENLADKYGEFAGFCGFLQNCGGNGNGNMGNQVQSDSDSSSGSGSSSSNSSSGEAARPAGAQ